MSSDDIVERHQVRLCIDGSITGALVAQAGREVALQAGFASERASRFGVIVEELVRESRTREAVDGDESSDIEISFDGLVLRCVVTDHRLPLTHTEIDAAPVHRLAALRFADRLDIAFAPPAGNRAIVEIRRDQDDDVFLGLERDEHEEIAVEDLVGEIEIRPMQPDDAQLLVRCLYRCYGYTYPDSDLYLESHITNLLEAGRLHSTVAISPDGEMVGHRAVVFEEENQRLPEIGKLIIDPRFRAHKLTARLAEDPTLGALVGSLPGYFARCVTNHPISQAIATSHGGVETGLLLGVAPADFAMTGGLPHSHGGRMSLLTVHRLFKSVGGATLSIPTTLVDEFTHLIAASNLERALDTELHEPSGRTEATFCIDHGFGIAEINLRSIGSDLLSWVASRLREVAQARIDHVELSLNAEDPSASWAIAALEDLGFFYAGWLPEFTDKGDRIQLQKVTPGTVDLDGMVFARAEGERVRDFAIAEWQRVAGSSRLL